MKKYSQTIFNDLTGSYAERIVTEDIFIGKYWGCMAGWGPSIILPCTKIEPFKKVRAQNCPIFVASYTH